MPPSRARPATSPSTARSSAGLRSSEPVSANREADNPLELVERLTGLADLDGGHAHRPRRLEVDAQVVQEDRLGRLDGELVAGHLVEPGVRLAPDDLARLHAHAGQA